MKKRKNITRAQAFGLETLKMIVSAGFALAVIDFMLHDEYTLELFAWFVVSLVMLAAGAAAVDRLERNLIRGKGWK